MNLLCGAIGVICAFEGRLDLSFMFMLAAALCDFCDGLCARMLNAFSPIGKELDSLADLVSFGLLPALMFRELARESDAHWLLTYVPLLLVVFSALRPDHCDTVCAHGKQDTHVLDEIQERCESRITAVQDAYSFHRDFLRMYSTGSPAGAELVTGHPSDIHYLYHHECGEPFYSQITERQDHTQDPTRQGG